MSFKKICYLLALQALVIFPLNVNATGYEPARIRSLPTIQSGNPYDDKIRKLNQYIRVGNQIADEFEKTLDSFKGVVSALGTMNKLCPGVWGANNFGGLISSSLELANCNPEALRKERALMKSFASRLDNYEREVVFIKKKVFAMRKIIVVLSNKKQLDASMGVLNNHMGTSDRLRNEAKRIDGDG